MLGTIVGGHSPVDALAASKETNMRCLWLGLVLAATMAAGSAHAQRTCSDVSRNAIRARCPDGMLGGRCRESVNRRFQECLKTGTWPGVEFQAMNPGTKLERR
jgi:hypothetical protein